MTAFNELVPFGMHRYASPMKPEDETRIAANLAKIMAMICIRNTRLEELHAGLQPVTQERFALSMNHQTLSEIGDFNTFGDT